MVIFRSQKGSESKKKKKKKKKKRNTGSTNQIGLPVAPETTPEKTMLTTYSRGL